MELSNPQGCWKTFSTPLLYLILKEREFAAKEKLEIVNALGFRIHFARPPIPSPDCEAIADEDRIPFELFQEYTAKIENRNWKPKWGRHEVPAQMYSPQKILNLAGITAKGSSWELPENFWALTVALVFIVSLPFAGKSFQSHFIQHISQL